MNERELLLERKGHLVIVTLNRPTRLNAFSFELMNWLDETWVKLEHDPEVRAVVLTGAGEKAFCAGMDLKQTAEVAATGKDMVKLAKDATMANMRNFKKPIIGAANGLAFGGGFMLLVNCDIRIAVEGAQLGIREVKVGRGSPWAVPLLWELPLGICMEIVLTGEPLNAERLYQLGFLSRVVSRNELMPTAEAIGQAICEGAPLSVMAGKKTFRLAMDLGYERGIEEAHKLYEPVYASEDAVEGPRAFAEKRKPVWKGK